MVLGLWKWGLNPVFTKRLADSMNSVPSSDLLEYKRFRKLTYLERLADSRRISMFFHGLGLDATDYQEYLETHATHGIAVSLAGYAPGRPEPIPPVPAREHVEMVAGLVEKVGEENEGKEIDLIGFSLGADLVLQLAEWWTGDPARSRPPVSRVLLLDPNVNQSTMTISRLVASADSGDPVPALKRLVDLASDPDGLRSLCGYVMKLTSKDFGQVHRLANDMIRYWDPAGYEQFGTRVARVAEIADAVTIALSADYASHLEKMRDAVRGKNRHAPDVSINITELDHFGLIGNEFLSRQLQSIERQPGRGPRAPRLALFGADAPTRGAAMSGTDRPR